MNPGWVWEEVLSGDDESHLAVVTEGTTARGADWADRGRPLRPGGPQARATWGGPVVKRS